MTTQGGPVRPMTSADAPSLAEVIRHVPLHVHTPGTVTPVHTCGTLAEVVDTLRDLTDTAVLVRTGMPLYSPYVEWLREGRKVTTIRYRENAVELPIADVLPLLRTDDYGPGPDPDDDGVRTTPVLITGMHYRRFGDLDERDAWRDGFTARYRMRRALKDIYPHLRDADWVSVYEISQDTKHAKDRERSPLWRTLR